MRFRWDQTTKPGTLVKDDASMPRLRIAFTASNAPPAQEALAELTQRHGSVAPQEAQYIVAL
ncbi:MAG: hypothetical protein KKI16_07335, partial [Alphaproteobacteria bacterium]|nr:hypothetical protein [Alphaproteobacteria bacterium]